jgi:hypothetical protein
MRSRGTPACPVAAARAVLQLVESENPPPQLLLGSDALQLVRSRLARMNQEIDEIEQLTISTDG